MHVERVRFLRMILFFFFVSLLTPLLLFFLSLLPLSLFSPSLSSLPLSLLSLFSPSPSLLSLSLSSLSRFALQSSLGGIFDKLAPIILLTANLRGALALNMQVQDYRREHLEAVCVSFLSFLVSFLVSFFHRLYIILAVLRC